MENAKHKIVETASSLYRKFGIKSVTMDDIARECMISKKTLYKYVNDKADLLIQTFRFEFDVQEQRFELITKKNINAIEKILEINKILISMLKTHKPSIEYEMRKYYPVIHKELVEKVAKLTYKSMCKNLKLGIREGLYYDDINVELIAKKGVIMQIQKIDNVIASYKDFLKPKAIKEMFKYHMRAICTPKCIEILNKKIKEL